MAKATERFDTRPVGVTLELSNDEAQTIRDILSMVGGSVTKSPRKHAQAVADALAELGYEFNDSDEMLQPGWDRPLIFKDYAGA